MLSLGCYDSDDDNGKDGQNHLFPYNKQLFCSCSTQQITSAVNCLFNLFIHSRHFLPLPQFWYFVSLLLLRLIRNLNIIITDIVYLFTYIIINVIAELFIHSSIYLFFFIEQYSFHYYHPLKCYHFVNQLLESRMTLIDIYIIIYRLLLSHIVCYPSILIISETCLLKHIFRKYLSDIRSI